MTTVGYGDVYAVSPFGRMISIINALWGAFVISMLVSSIGQIFDLSERQKRAIAQITNHKQAAKSLKASFKFFIAKSEYKKSMRGENIAEGYVPTKEEIQQLKDKMDL